MCDRTQEFLSICQSIGGVTGSTTTTGSSIANKRNIGSSSSSSSGDRDRDRDRDINGFNDAAADIARGVHKTSAMLAKLTNLVRKQGLFDDPTEEINALIYRIKQDLDALNAKCDAAQLFIDAKKGGGSGGVGGGLFSLMSSSNAQTQSSVHNGKVVSQLKTDLLKSTKEFKVVLELRSSKMKDQQQRKVELIGKTAGLSALNSLEQSVHNNNNGNTSSKSTGESNSLVKRSNSTIAKRALPSPYTNDVDDLYGGTNTNRFAAVEDPSQQHQQLLLEPMGNVEYYDARAQAVTEVEKTIGELGTLFKRLATMLQEQQEVIERIDEDVENAVTNTDNAKNALVKALESASSNRGMYMKLGGIFAIFFLLFVLFLM